MPHQFTLCDLSPDIEVVAVDFDSGFYEYVRYTATDGKRHQVGLNHISQFNKSLSSSDGLRDAVKDLRLTTLHGSIPLGELLEAIDYGREHVKGDTPSLREYVPNPKYDPARAARIFEEAFTHNLRPERPTPSRSVPATEEQLSK